MRVYYQGEPRELDMYQRLIQYWSMMFDRRQQICVLDNMNFNLSLYPQVLRPEDIVRLHPIEPGYMSPDGSTELGQLIRELEYARLIRLCPARQAQFRAIADAAGVGCGNGCSNVMNALLNSILKLSRPRFHHSQALPEIILTLPNYTVYAAQVANLAGAMTPRYIHAQRENNFLPALSELEQVVTDRTIAFVLTYPNNPAQSTYEGSSLAELKKIVSFCQERSIFLIVDNIYQDLIFPRGRAFAEVFSLTDSLDYIIKIYGSSKDTPFFSGFRTGYWFGDRRVEELYRYYISSTENSLNTQSIVLFALNLYFKTKGLLNTLPTQADMEQFSTGIFGWSQTTNSSRLFQNMQELDLYAKYSRANLESNRIQEQALRKLIDFMRRSRCFSDYVNQLIGNVFFIRVAPEYFNGHDDDFFQHLFYQAQYGVLPGNVFGMPIIADQVWFRITTTHETADTLIAHLDRLETFLLR